MSNFDESKIYENLEEIFSCSICYAKLNDPRLCPLCSKMFCLKCIEEWLETDSSEGKCPNCKDDLKDKLVKIRWIEDINKVMEVKVEKMSNENGKCHAHNRIAKMFCRTCNASICLNCIEKNLHPRHLFENLNDVFQTQVAILKEQNNKLDKKLDEIYILNEAMTKFTNDIKMREEINLLEMKTIRDDAIELISKKYENIAADIAKANVYNIDKINIKKSEIRALEAELDDLKNKNEDLLNSCKTMVAGKRDSINKITGIIEKIEVPTREIDLNTYDRYVEFQLLDYCAISKAYADLSEINENLNPFKWALQIMIPPSDDSYLAAYIGCRISPKYPVKIKFSISLVDQCNINSPIRLSAGNTSLISSTDFRGFQYLIKREDIHKFLKSEDNTLKFIAYIKILDE